MKTVYHQRRISPEAIAYKLAAKQNFYTPNFAAQFARCPQMRELLWFIQWQSLQPGGLVKFSQHFAEALPGRIGTPAMKRIGPKALSEAERQSIIDEIPRYDCQAGTAAGRAAVEFFNATRNDFEECGVRPDREALAKLDFAGFHALCIKAAQNDLPRRLAWFCGLPAAPDALVTRHWRDDEERDIAGEDRCLEDAWYCPDLLAAMVEMMDVHQRREGEKLAKTETADKVCDALQFALEEQAAVIIEGDTRFGKTKSVTTWADMRPGVGRVVRTPCSNVQFDLLRAVADAIGIEVPLGMSRRELQHKVEFVLQHGGLFLIFDESHYLFPRLVSRNTTPARLDWVREQIMDRHCPLALVSTPQEFAHSLKRFTKTTNHNIAQFMGRIAITVALPDELGDADLLNVARIHFPDLPESHLELIACKALQTEKFLATVESLAKRVRYIARREQHPAPTLEDLDLAISEVIGPAPLGPRPPIAAARTPRRRRGPLLSTAEVTALSRGASATGGQPLEMPPRTTAPLLEPV